MPGSASGGRANQGSATDATDDDTGRYRGPAKRVRAHRFRASSWPRRGLRCDDIVELVTSYHDAAQLTAMRRRFEQRLRGCAGCAAYLDELRVALAIVGLPWDEEL